MDFEIPGQLAELQQQVRQFIENEVIALEPLERDEGLPAAQLNELRAKAHAAGLWAPQLPR